MRRLLRRLRCALRGHSETTQMVWVTDYHDHILRSHVVRRCLDCGREVRP